MKMLSEISGREKNSFGLVRLLAAVAVVTSHAFLLTGGSFDSEPLLTTTSYPLGGHAVHAFFALSGFLIAASWFRNPDLFHYLSGRFLRLFPALFVVTLSVIAIGEILYYHDTSRHLIFSSEVSRFFARTVLMLDGGGKLPSVFPQSEVSGSVLATVWTLRYEVFCYLSIPLIGLLSLSNKKLTWIFAVTILTASAVLLVVRDKPYHNANMIDNLTRFFFTFYLGVFAWKFRKILPLSIIGVVALIFLSWLGLGSPMTKVLEILALTYLTFWVASINFGVLAEITNQEDISYGVYLMGYPIQQALIALFPNLLSPLANLVLAMLLVVPLAFLSWRLIERPSLACRNSCSRLAERLFGLLFNKSAEKISIAKAN